MNERIQELEKLATPRCYDENGCYIGNKFDIAKFAELLITECARLIDAEEIQSSYGSMLKEHFGVEE